MLLTNKQKLSAFQAMLEQSKAAEQSAVQNGLQFKQAGSNDAFAEFSRLAELYKEHGNGMNFQAFVAMYEGFGGSAEKGADDTVSEEEIDAALAGLDIDDPAPTVTAETIKETVGAAVDARFGQFEDKIAAMLSGTTVKEVQENKRIAELEKTMAEAQKEIAKLRGDDLQAFFGAGYQPTQQNSVNQEALVAMALKQQADTGGIPAAIADGLDASLGGA